MYYELRNLLFISVFAFLLIWLFFTQFTLFMLSVLFLLFILGLKYPKQALFIFLFYAAFHYWYYALLGTKGITDPRQVSEPAFLKLLKDAMIIFIYVFCLCKMLIKGEIDFPGRKFLFPLMLFIAVAVVQAVRGIGDNTFLGIIALRNVIIYIPLVLITPYLIKTKNDIENIIKLLLGGAVIVSLVGVYEYFYGGLSVYRDYSPLLRMLVNRIYSTLYNTNNLAIYLGIFILICFSSYLNKVYIFNKNISLLVLSLFSFCLLATQSRSGLAMVMLGILFLLLINKKKKAFLAIATFLTISVLLIQVAAPQLFYRYRLVFNPIEENSRDASKIARLGVAQHAYEIIEKDPAILLGGVGITRIGNVRAAEKYLALEDKSEGIGDNYYLQLLIGMGMFGLLFFVWILTTIFKESLKLFRVVDDMFLKSLVGAIGAIVIGFAFLGFLGQIWELFPNNLYFWFMVGLLISVRNICKEKSFVLDG